MVHFEVDLAVDRVEVGADLAVVDLDEEVQVGDGNIKKYKSRLFIRNKRHLY